MKLSPFISNMRSRPSRWLYLIPPFLVAVLVVVDINPSGLRVARYGMKQKSPVISELFPSQRLAGIENDRQQVLQLPIYFSVRYPHRYDVATIKVSMQNPSNVAWKIGLQVDDSEAWAYYLVEPSVDGIATFDLHNAAVANRSIRFIISSDELETAALFVTGIDIRLQRPKLLAWL